MDFITHSLVGAATARLVTPRKELLPQATLAGIGGSMLMDSDSWLFFLGPDAYGRFHRVFTHCIWMLVFWVVLSAALVRVIGYVRVSRRFGWFLTANLAPEPISPRAPWGLLLLIAAVAAAMHWLGDVITGYGNLQPYWPFSKHEYSFNIVTSFDWFIFGVTFSYHLATRELDWPRRKEAWLAGAWLAAVISYLFIRHALGYGSVW